MRASQIRWLVALAAFVLTASPSAPARAAEVDVPAIESTFSGGVGNWTATSACAPLCTVTNTVDASSGASSPGSATVVYTTLGGLLGGLATGTSTWKSPSFTWSSPTPGHATLSFARKAAVSSLLAVGGTASSRIQLDDLTTDTTTTVVTQGISAADSSFVTREQVIDPSLLRQSHAYSLLVTTNLSAAALLSNIRVAYDDIRLVGSVEQGRRREARAAPATPEGREAPGGTGGAPAARARRHRGAPPGPLRQAERPACRAFPARPLAHAPCARCPRGQGGRSSRDRREHRDDDPPRIDRAQRTRHAESVAEGRRAGSHHLPGRRGERDDVGTRRHPVNA